MRKVLLPSLIILATSLLVVRIFYLQIVDDTLKLKSENNAKKKYVIIQNAVIFMTERKAIIANQASYDIMVIPREVKNTDTLEFCQLLNIKRRFYKKIEKATVYSPRLPSVFLPQLNKRNLLFSRKIRKYEGFIFKNVPYVIMKWLWCKCVWIYHTGK
jgi:penicillin-binding protein 2